MLHENTDKLLSLFDRPRLIGLISDANQGKSNLLYWTIKSLSDRYNFRLYSYGLRARVANEMKIYSVEELEVLHDSVIIIDEFASLFDVDDRKEKKQIEKTLRLIFHKNNVVLLSGLPENFKKFIASKLDAMIFKRCALKDAINGSRVKQVMYGFEGEEMGAAMLNIDIGDAVMYRPDEPPYFHHVTIPLVPEFDTKAGNVSILVPKNVKKTSEKK